LTLIVAHRGASVEQPENTLASFESAIDAGADMIEFDVRRGLDGKLVISHDPVVAFEHATLEDTLGLTQGRIQLDVELKEPGCEGETIELLLRYFQLKDFCITSFLAASLRETGRIHPGIRKGLIFDDWDETLRAACLSTDADFLVAHYRLLGEAEQIGKPLFVWTVDDGEQIRRLFERPSVEAIITNDPRQAVFLRSRLALR
jgi:glycerophosphoryl diester phosphodiesterase